MATYESPGAGRVLIALAAGPLVAEPTWTRYDELTNCRCEGFDVSRGRQSELDTTDTGTARVFFHDRAQVLNDDDLIGLQIMLQTYDPVVEEWQPCFRGHIDDMSSELSPGAPELANVQVDCVDVFDYLGGARMLVGVFGDALPSGMGGVVFYEDGPVDDRLTTLLTDAGLASSMYVVFTGNVEVNETLYDPQDTILQALRDGADAEFPGIANVYVDRFGRVVFHGRFARFDPDTVSGDAGDAAWDFQRWSAATREDVTSGVAQIREFAFNRPRDRIINAYTAWPRADENGVAFDMGSMIGQVSTDSGSISAYGYRSREAGDLIIKRLKPAVGTSTGTEQCKLIADFYVANYNVARKNVQRVTFKSLRPDDARAEATWALMTRCDVSDIIALTVDEAGLAAEDYYVEGIQLSCRRLNPRFDMVTVTPNLSPAAYYTDNVFE